MGQFDSEKAHLIHLVTNREAQLAQSLLTAPAEEREDILASLSDVGAAKEQIEAMEDHSYVCESCGNPFTSPACVRRKIVEIVETDAEGESSRYRYNSSPRIEVMCTDCASARMPLDKAEAEPASVAALEVIVSTKREQRLASLAQKES